MLSLTCCFERPVFALKLTIVSFTVPGTRFNRELYFFVPRTPRIAKQNRRVMWHLQVSGQENGHLGQEPLAKAWDTILH